MEPAAAPASALEAAAPPPSPPSHPRPPSPPQPLHDQPRQQDQHMDEVDTTADLIAGWLGGAVGVLVGNPFEVLKVRLQTSSTHSHHPSPSAPRVGKSSVPPLPSPAFPFPPPPTPLGQMPVPAVSSSAPKGMHPTVSPPPIPLSGVSSSLSTPSSSSAPPQAKDAPPRVGLLSLYRTEGFRFFFAGTAGPILGLAFIDSAFFGLYGRVMQTLGQDRQDPNSLFRVFLSGATAGGLCALLETPIEVVKTRAQVESVPTSSSSSKDKMKPQGKKLGSFRIASQIARTEGLRGFYIGGLMTAVHDGISSGIFFSAYFVLRRLLRGEHPFHAAPLPSSSSPLEALASPLPSQPPYPVSSSPASASALSPSPALASVSATSSSPPSSLSPFTSDPTLSFAPSRPLPDSDAALSASEEDEAKKHGGMGKGEVARILLAGGLAGALSAIVPYPFDIVKTRLQTANFESRARSSPVTTASPSSTFTSNATPFHSRSSSASSAASANAAAPPKMTVRSVFRGIHAEGVSAWRYRYPSTWLYSFLSHTVFPSPSSSSSVPGLAPAEPARGRERARINLRAEKWALRLLGMRAFTVGLGPTVVSSFVGSAATITTVELALHFMGVNGGGGGVG